MLWLGTSFYVYSFFISIYYNIQIHLSVLGTTYHKFLQVTMHQSPLFFNKYDKDMTGI